MKSKLLNHYVDVFCKKFLGYCIFYSAKEIANNGSGTYILNFLKNEYLFENKPQNSLNVAMEIQAWFDEMILKDNFMKSDFQIAELIVNCKAPEKYRIPSHTIFEFNCNAKIEYKGKVFKNNKIGMNSDLTMVG